MTRLQGTRVAKYVLVAKLRPKVGRKSSAAGLCGRRADFCGRRGSKLNCRRRFGFGIDSGRFHELPSLAIFLTRRSFGSRSYTHYFSPFNEGGGKDVPDVLLNNVSGEEIDFFRRVRHAAITSA